MRFCRSTVALCALLVQIGSGLSLFADEPSTPAPPSEPAKPKPRVTISKETTYITEPLRPDGYPDYIEAANRIASQGVTPQNNAVVLIMEALGPEVVEPAIRPEFFRRLGVAMPPKGGKYFVTLFWFAERSRPSRGDGDIDSKYYDALNDQFERCRAHPWSAEDAPDLAKWLQLNEEPLRLVATAARRPRCYFPLAPEGSMLSCILPPAIQELLEVNRALAAWAMLRVQERQFDKAIEDLMTCRRLAWHVGQGHTLIERLVGIALDGIAMGTLACAMHHGKWPAGKLGAIEKEFAELSAWPALAGRIDIVERMIYLDFVCMFARQGLADLRYIMAGVWFGTKPGFWEQWGHAVLLPMIDWDEPLRFGNRCYDRLAEALREPTLAKREARREAFDQDLRQNIADARSPARLTTLALLGSPGKAAGHWLGGVVVGMLMTGNTSVARQDDAHQTRDMLLRVAVAIEIYRAEHGRYPATLDDVAPRLAPALLDDPYGNGRFRYRRDGAGYWLYSVGRNGRDDGGRHYADDDADDDTSADIDDLAIRVPPPKPRKP